VVTYEVVFHHEGNQAKHNVNKDLPKGNNPTVRHYVGFEPIKTGQSYHTAPASSKRLHSNEKC